MKKKVIAAARFRSESFFQAEQVFYGRHFTDRPFYCKLIIRF